MDEDYSLDEFDPSDNDFIQNPYGWYSILRKMDPVHFVESTGSFWITRYSDVSAALSDSRFGSHYISTATGEPGLDTALKLWSRTMLYSDPPDHTRLRSLVTRTFIPSVVESLRPNILAISSGLIDAIDASKRFDLIEAYAAPFPALVIAELLGVDPDYRDKFKEWSNDIVKGMDGTLPEDILRKSQSSSLALASYFVDLIDEKRRKPGIDLVSRLILDGEKGNRLESEELLAMCLLLLVAGHETTTNLIANGFFSLLGDKGKMKELERDRSLMHSAVEEMLRFESPVQRIGRIALNEVNIAGIDIPRGTMIAALVGSANRDPDRFAAPESLDLKRKENQHLAFGKGIHFCLGSPLARLEAYIAFNGLLDKLSDVNLAGEVEWSRNTVMRGLKKLEISL